MNQVNQLNELNPLKSLNPRARGGPETSVKDRPELEIAVSAAKEKFDAVAHDVRFSVAPQKCNDPEKLMFR